MFGFWRQWAQWRALERRAIVAHWQKLLLLVSGGLSWFDACICCAALMRVQGSGSVTWSVWMPAAVTPLYRVSVFACTGLCCLEAAPRGPAAREGGVPQHQAPLSACPDSLAVGPGLDPPQALPHGSIQGARQAAPAATQRVCLDAVHILQTHGARGTALPGQEACLRRVEGVAGGGLLLLLATCADVSRSFTLQPDPGFDSSLTESRWYAFPLGLC